MAKRIDASSVESLRGTMYPPPYDEPCLTRVRKQLGDAAGLTQFGVNLLVLPPGAWSSQRHWHTKQDEFVYVLSGNVVLVTDSGEEYLLAGDAAAFKANDPDGHCLQNRSRANAVLLEIGSREPGDRTTYPGLDLVCPVDEKPATYTHADGTPYLGLVQHFLEDH